MSMFHPAGIGNRAAAVLLRDNMVQLERRGRKAFGQLAVFAAVACTPAHQLLQELAHAWLEAVRRVFRAIRALECKMSSTQPRRS